MPVVKLYANLRKVVGAKEISVHGATLSSALSDLIRQHPPLGEALLDHGVLRPHVILTVNGQTLVDQDEAIDEQAVIAIFPPIAGGSVPCRPRRCGQALWSNS